MNTPLKRQGIVLLYPADNPGESGFPRLVITHDGDQQLPAAFVDSFPFFKQKLESKDTVQHLIDECCLLEDRFEGDESYTFDKVELKNFQYVYTFKNSEAYVLEIPFRIESIGVI